MGLTRGSGAHAESMVAVSLASLAAAEAAGEGASSGASNRRPCSVQGSTLREHFHLPLHTVAHKFGMCTTAFKKMCRRLGIAKWPHRQLRGIDKKIAALKAELTYASNGDRQQFLSGLTSLEEEKSRLANGLLGGEGTFSGNGSEVNPSHASADDMDDDDVAHQAASPVSARDTASGDHESEEAEESFEEEEESNGEPVSREGGASSGGATAGMVISEAELRSNFHLPLHTAARKFGICTTAFKKLCRRFGIAKWPHRQLRGIDKKIAALKAELNYTTGDRQGCRKSLQSLQEEKARLSSPGATCETPAKRKGGAAATGGSKRGSSTKVSEEHSEESEDEEMAVDEDEAEEAEEDQKPLPCSSSALDLLAAVAGVKEEHDRVEEEAKKSMMPSSEAGHASRVSSDDDTQSGAPCDTPPLEPVDIETPCLSSVTQPQGKMCMSPMLGACTKQPPGHGSMAPMGSSMVPMGSSTPLIGLSWTGEPCAQMHMSLDQCA